MAGLKRGWTGEMGTSRVKEMVGGLREDREKGWSEPIQPTKEKGEREDFEIKNNAEIQLK